MNLSQEKKLWRTDRWGCCIILFDPMNSNRILLCKRAAGDRQEPGTWGLPGGKVEVGESAEEATIRELKEETGLEVEHIKFLGQFVNNGWQDYVFLADKFSGEMKLDPNEVEGHVWATIEEIEAKCMSTYVKLDEIFSFTTQALNHYKLWKEIEVHRAMEAARKKLIEQYP
jgi:mutator protein MutT